MNPQEAHDIVNKEINVILIEIEECKNTIHKNAKNDYSSYIHSNMLERLKELRPKLKGIISMEASEIEFLGKRIEFLEKRFGIFQPSTYEFERLQALKISINDLKEKVK